MSKHQKIIVYNDKPRSMVIPYERTEVKGPDGFSTIGHKTQTFAPCVNTEIPKDIWEKLIKVNTLEDLVQKHGLKIVTVPVVEETVGELPDGDVDTSSATIDIAAMEFWPAMELVENTVDTATLKEYLKQEKGRKKTQDKKPRKGLMSKLKESVEANEKADIDLETESKKDKKQGINQG